MRFWIELRNPALKCERVGHKTETQTRSGMVRSDRYRFVADKVHQEREWCPRCGIAHTDWRDTSRTGISSWSAPSEIMREFERTGEHWY